VWMQPRRTNRDVDGERQDRNYTLSSLPRRVGQLAE
jgi:hypothetical protein